MTVAEQATAAPNSTVEALAPDPIYQALTVTGRALNDLEAFRIATQNRLDRMLALHRTPLADMQITDGGIKLAEQRLIKELVAAWKFCPLRGWQQQTPGIGDKSLARLIAEIGDPSLKAVGHMQKVKAKTDTGFDRMWVIDGYAERSLGDLFAYCGHGSPDHGRRKGMSQAELFKRGRAKAKMRVYLLAEIAMKLNGEPDLLGRQRQRSPYRDVYEQRRIDTVDRVHVEECVRCGPSGNPALPGTPWSKAHQHADALRIVGKRILEDLYFEARRLRGV